MAQNLTVLGLVFLLVISCDKPEEIRNGEGYLGVKGGKIWYRITGQGSQTTERIESLAVGYMRYSNQH